MVIGAVTKESERFKRTYEMVKQLKCFRWFRVRKGARTFRKRFRSLLKYLWPFRVRKGVGNSEPPEPLCGSWLNTVKTYHFFGYARIVREPFKMEDENRRECVDVYRLRRVQSHARPTSDRSDLDGEESEMHVMAL